eukprot:m.242899 g.242899  ORF g.242899 m.242899 type:complete len:72 (-) comp26348_c1_seq1:614-829(-)
MVGCSRVSIDDRLADDDRWSAEPAASESLGPVSPRGIVWLVLISVQRPWINGMEHLLRERYAGSGVTLPVF